MIQNHLADVPITITTTTRPGVRLPAAWSAYLRPTVVYGLPVLLWAVVLFVPQQAYACVVLVVGAQLAYFLVRPTAERAVWTLLSYLFSVGGAPLISYDQVFTSVPSWMTWLSYVIIPVAAVVTLGTRRRWRGRGVALACAATVLVGAVSGIVNQTSLNDWVGWSLHNLRYPLLLVALRSSAVGVAQYRAMIRSFLILTIIQIPATALQFLVSISISGEWNEDRTVGTMFGAQTGLMGLTVIAGFISLLSLALVSRRPVLVVIACFITWAPLLFGGAGFPLAVGVVLTAYVLLRWSFAGRHRLISSGGAVLIRRNVALLIPVAGLIAGGLVLVSVIMFPERDQSATVSSRSELTDWLTGQSSSLTSLAAFTDPTVATGESRQRFIATAFQWFTLHPEGLLLGSLGPRLALGQSVSQVNDLSNASSASPLDPINIALGLDPQLAQFVVQLPRTLLEVGVAGLACLLWLYWQAWKIGRRAARRGRSDPWVRGQALAFEAIWLLYVVLSVLYQDVWRLDQTSFVFWLWAAALASVQHAPSPEAVGWPAPAGAGVDGQVLESSGGTLQ